MTTLHDPPLQKEPGQPSVSERAKGERRLGLYLTLPSYIVMLLVTAYPLGYALVLSLYNFRLTDPEGRSFVGLRNYGVILTDPVWWNDFVTTLAITVVTVAVELVLGFWFAFVMLRIVRGRGPLRTAILIPYGIVTVVSAFIWRYAFAIDSGFVNQWLNLTDFDWFGDRWSAIFVICLSEIWKTTPFISLLLLAGLVQVPEDMQEAAKVDGATAWQRLWKVTLPNMKAAIMVALLFRTLDAWRIFDNPYVMTAGANNTETISFLAYRQNVTLVNLGMGSAVSVLLFLSVVAIAWIFIKVFKTDLSQVRGDQ
ncbi:sugar ABC transporter permease [Mycolicibacterium obuense]|uniref:ABC transporter permease n=1 Tax=Mycolicibacterium obuense TaxID=1807 RepID=A0A0J6W259_9MYCO|nr:sugar ABC transporter permease [Mycolicibacterium obuense]KKF01956.1 ABC transporter permease [Mycolicibacterium obuense]KMO76479.1 Trehalose transport system permease protein SugA [Mycolicibacterium obuense]OKH66206.1 ABC transporter permease [Mycobacterium sp. SWH-M1]TDL03612.1 sugar ABC transporter permease [Mycolicibacterium obuense]